MMVPTAFETLDESSLFSESAKESYRDEPGRARELKATVPVTDESVASFVGRHFGAEVLETIAAPLWRSSGRQRRDAERAGGDGSLRCDGARARQPGCGAAG